MQLRSSVTNSVLDCKISRTFSTHKNVFPQQLELQLKLCTRKSSQLKLRLFIWWERHEVHSISEKRGCHGKYYERVPFLISFPYHKLFSIFHRCSMMLLTKQKTAMTWCLELMSFSIRLLFSLLGSGTQQLEQNHLKMFPLRFVHCKTQKLLNIVMKFCQVELSLNLALKRVTVQTCCILCCCCCQFTLRQPVSCQHTVQW